MAFFSGGSEDAGTWLSLALALALALGGKEKPKGNGEKIRVGTGVCAFSSCSRCGWLAGLARLAVLGYLIVSLLSQIR